jgi:hypothetical protein
VYCHSVLCTGARNRYLIQLTIYCRSSASTLGWQGKTCATIMLHYVKFTQKFIQKEGKYILPYFGKSTKSIMLKSFYSNNKSKFNKHLSKELSFFIFNQLLSSNLHLIKTEKSFFTTFILATLPLQISILLHSSTSQFQMSFMDDI